MNSLNAKNAALLLIFYLLWFVLSGIYKSHAHHVLTRETKVLQKQASRDEQPGQISTTGTLNPSSIYEASRKQRELTGEEIKQISYTGRLPDWVKHSKNKRLSLDEIEEIVTTGKLPEH